MNQDPVSSSQHLVSVRPEGQAGLPQRILVVDDDEAIRRCNAELLSRAGYAVDAAEDGAAAWEVLQVASYGLLITDNRMPKLSGFDLLKKLHGTRLAPRVIMATGQLPENEFARCPWVRPDATLVKPYSGAELLATVKSILLAPANARETRDRHPVRGASSEPMDSGSEDGIPGYHVETHINYPASVLGYVHNTQGVNSPDGNQPVVPT